jgi:SynChlorMet cassette radical SAM/SPASM protein ScmE
MQCMNTPRSVDLLLTSGCNLRCKYCSHFSSGGDISEDLRTEDWLKFFEELNHCAVMNVCLQGGEPLYREDFMVLVNGIVRNRMRFSVLSNGTLITDEIAEFLASTHRCDSVQISIDGSSEVTHDTCRGEGTFRRALAGLRALQRHGVPVTVRVTIHSKNVDDLEEVARLLLDDLGLPGFSTNSASHLGLCRQNADTVQLTVQDRCIAMNTLLKLARQYDNRITATSGPLAEARACMAMDKARSEGRDGFPGGGFLTSCGGTMSKIAVRADGALIPCAQLPDITLGKINEADLKDVWQNHPTLNRFRHRTAISLSDFDFCRSCPYIPYCKGSCPALAHSILNDAWHPSPDACLKRFLESGGVLPVEDEATWHVERICREGAE